MLKPPREERKQFLVAIVALKNAQGYGFFEKFLHEAREGLRDVLEGQTEEMKDFRQVQGAAQTLKSLIDIFKGAEESLNKLRGGKQR